jgi:uncharacterized protein with PIN domain
MRKKTAILRFYEELNDFLPPVKRKTDFSYHFFGTPTVKDCIEANGIPHTEVDLILIDGKSASFDYHLHGGESISVYPVFESLDITPVIRLRPHPLRKTKFICDVHLGKLARQLRMLGFDVYFDKSIDDVKIVEQALKDKRIILTRDQGILKRKEVSHGYWVRSTDVRHQLPEVCRRFDLNSQIKPFTVCMICNGTIVTINKADIQKNIPRRVQLNFDQFFQCTECHKIYWKGSHYQKMECKVEQLLNSI